MEASAASGCICSKPGQLFEGILFRLLGHTGLGDLRRYSSISLVVSSSRPVLLDGPQLLPQEYSPGCGHFLPGLFLILALDGETSISLRREIMTLMRLRMDPF